MFMSHYMQLRYKFYERCDKLQIVFSLMNRYRLVSTYCFYLRINAYDKQYIMVCLCISV